MTRLPLLALRMLRYRVAAMLWLFMLLGAAAQNGLATLGWRHLLAGAALAASYVAATSLNDVADRELDLVNHPRDAGRPLVTGEASPRQLVLLAALACPLALGLATPLGPSALAATALGLAIAIAYSVRPLALSYRTVGAPLVLAVGYVLVPFALGAAAAGEALGVEDTALCTALVLLFVARIVLKDFRDREGDARYGRPTVLLRHGKGATCTVSASCLLLGTVALLSALHVPTFVTLLLLPYAGAAAFLVRRLHAAAPGRDEQVAIGAGARAGNGLLLVALGALVLAGHGADTGTQVAFALALGSLFALALLALASDADVVVGYKG